MKNRADLVENLDKIPVNLAVARELWLNNLLSNIKQHNYTSEDKYKIEIQTEESDEIKDILSAVQFLGTLVSLRNKGFINDDFTQAAGDILDSGIKKYDREAFWERYNRYVESPDTQSMVMRVSNDLARALTKKENPLPEAMFISAWVTPLFNICESVVTRAFEEEGE